MSKHFNLTKIKLLTYHLLTALTLVSQGWGTSPLTPDATQDIPKKIRILLVEDSEKIEMPKFKKFLEKKGLEAGFQDIQIRWAKNGEEGLNIMTTEVFDFIITDYNMPGMDGDTFCRTFIKENPILYKYDPNRTLVFAHTANEDFDKIDGVKTKFINAGVDEDKIFKKPSSIRKIIKMIFNI